jgi:hypothetical protein
MFISNKYTKWYYTIINSAKDNIRDGYLEKHHILPTSLGGKNIVDNLVALSPREHYICHLLLTKMTEGQAKYKMAFALSMMHKVKNIGEGRYVPSNRLYEYARKQFKIAMGEFWTDENRAIHATKISKATKGSKKSEQARESYRNKVWTDAAKANRLTNCLKSAAERKGKKNPAHGETIFKNYAIKNKEIISQIWQLYDAGKNRRQIALQLNITWDRVNVAINKRIDIEKHI